MKLIGTIVLALALSACAFVGQQPTAPQVVRTPEGQILAGANSVNAAATLSGVLLKNGKISVPAAKSYSVILHSILDHLNVANVDLVACRAKTGSTQKTSPDPCWPTVSADIELALSLAGDINKTLKAKE